jgi:hypothetical protein
MACAHGVSHQVASRVLVYQDPRITVISPVAQEEMKIKYSNIRAQVAVDAVSGATQALTIDAVSAATKFTERRVQGSISGLYSPHGKQGFSGGYTMSSERDHKVHAPNLGWQNEILAQMVRISVNYLAMIESIGRVDQPSYEQRALAHRIDGEWTQILSRTWVVSALATATATTCTQELGCVANSYRAIGIETGLGRIALPERHPDQRFTGAAALRTIWNVAGKNAIHAGYRFFGDSWRIAAHTVDASWVTGLAANHVLLRTEVRSTVQNAASFYRRRYLATMDGAPAYRTADSELSRLRNLRLALAIEGTWRKWKLFANGGRMWNWYPEYTALPKRHAWLLGVGASYDF